MPTAAFLQWATRCRLLACAFLGPKGNQPQHVADACAEKNAVHGDEGDKRRRELQHRLVRYPFGRAHYAVDDPGLTADLGRDPTCEKRDQTSGAHQGYQAQEASRLKEPPPPPQPRAAYTQQEHEEPESHHQAEGPEDNCRVWTILPGKLLEPGKLAVQAVRQDEAPQVGDFDCIASRLATHVR